MNWDGIVTVWKFYLIFHLRITVPSDPENSTSWLCFFLPYYTRCTSIKGKSSGFFLDSLLCFTFSKPSNSYPIQVDKVWFKKQMNWDFFFFLHLAKLDFNAAAKITPYQSATWKCYFAFIWHFLFSLG